MFLFVAKFASEIKDLWPIRTKLWLEVMAFFLAPDIKPKIIGYRKVSFIMCLLQYLIRSQFIREQSLSTLLKNKNIVFCILIFWRIYGGEAVSKKLKTNVYHFTIHWDPKILASRGNGAGPFVFTQDLQIQETRSPNIWICPPWKWTEVTVIGYWN